MPRHRTPRKLFYAVPVGLLWFRSDGAIILVFRLPIGPFVRIAKTYVDGLQASVNAESARDQKGSRGSQS